jgi:hypothetical protein
MRLPTRISLAIFPLAALAGCGQSDTDPGPGGVTVGEARALDEAAEMLDHRRTAPGATPTAPHSSDATKQGDGQ